MWIYDSDGWRDESSEGPYTETLLTLYDWKGKFTWKIVRLHTPYHPYRVESPYSLYKDHELVGEFPTIEDAKAATSAVEPPTP